MTDPKEEIEREVRAFLRESAPKSAEFLATLGPNEPLWNAVDSLSILELAEYLEQRFAVVIEPAHFVPENFATIGRITRLIARLREG